MFVYSNPKVKLPRIRSCVKVKYLQPLYATVVRRLAPLHVWGTVVERWSLVLYGFTTHMRLCPIPILIHMSECSVQLGLEPLRPLWGHELDCTWSQRSTLCTQFANQAFASSNKHITTPLLLQCPTQRASLLQFDYNGQNLLKMVVKVIKYCITISHTAHTPHCTRPTLYTPHTAHAPHCTRPTLYTPHTVHTPHCTRPTLTVKNGVL